MEQDYILLYDSDCGICSEAVVWLYKNNYHRHFSILPYYEFNFLNYPSISIELAQQTIIIINKESGDCYTHGNAVILLLFVMGGNYRKISKLIRQYKLTTLLNSLYKFIANNRGKISELLGFKSCKIRT